MDSSDISSDPGEGGSVSSRCDDEEVSVAEEVDEEVVSSPQARKKKQSRREKALLSMTEKLQRNMLTLVRKQP